MGSSGFCMLGSRLAMLEELKKMMTDIVLHGDRNGVPDAHPAQSSLAAENNTRRWDPFVGHVIRCVSQVAVSVEACLDTAQAMAGT
eukprot:1956103-Amphidinium_carterae.2